MKSKSYDILWQAAVAAEVALESFPQHLLPALHIFCTSGEVEVFDALSLDMGDPVWQATMEIARSRGMVP